MIYLDNASTTFVDDQVLKTFDKLVQEIPGNPSSNIN